MTNLVITRGLPASGKTTWAQSWVEADPLNRARVNRDDLRHNLYGRYTGLDYKQEERVTEVQRASVKALLEAGVSVVVDDTNLRLKHARAWADLGVTLGVDWEVLDFNLSATECELRDLARSIGGGRRVGGEVIRDFDRRYKQPWPKVEPTPVPAEQVWIPAKQAPDEPAWIVDIDGTLATNDGQRGWYEWAAVGVDNPKPRIVELVKDLEHAGYRIILMSGRDSVCRPETEAWLKEHNVPYDELYMRAEGDNRRDDVVKHELFHEHVNDRYFVAGVLDDRDQVVAMWRAIGLTCLQVAPGDF